MNRTYKQLISYVYRKEKTIFFVLKNVEHQKHNLRF